MAKANIENAFAKFRNGLRPADVAVELGIPRSSAYRLYQEFKASVSKDNVSLLTKKQRDAEWSRVVLGLPESTVLTPEEAVKWLEADRVTRARNVAEARQRRGPIRY